MNLLSQTIKQYGFFRTILICIKGMIKRTFHFSWYSYYIFHGSLNEDNAVLKKNYTEEIRKLEQKDFDHDFYKKTIDEKKRRIINGRFANPNIEGFGIFKDNLLVCYGWINYERLEIIKSTSLELPPKSALLFDDYCHPDYRGKGLHYIINDYRIRRLIENGIENVYSVVLKYNKPPIKNLVKLGLSISENFTLFVLGKRESCTIKKVGMPCS